MFGIDSSEFLLIGAVALVVIGPKDLPRLMRTAGAWIGKARRMSSHVRAGVDEMIRQAEATAADAVPAGKLPTAAAQLTTMLMTPDTRSKEPGGEKSTVAPLLPSPLALSLAPAPQPASPSAEPANGDVVRSEDKRELAIFEDKAALQPTASPMVVTLDTRSREPGGTLSTLVPLRPGALAASFTPATLAESDITVENPLSPTILVEAVTADGEFGTTPAHLAA